MIFGTDNKLRGIKHSPLYINNERVELVPVFKHIGVFLDLCQNISSHVNELYKKPALRLE